MKAYEDFAAGPLTFPIGGKQYVVPEVGWAAGLKLQELESGKLASDDISPEDQNRLLLGDVFDEMVADGVAAKAIDRAALTVLIDYRTGSRDAAEVVWESGRLPELPAAQEAATETVTTDTGEASSTKSADSTSGTTTRPRRTAKRSTPKPPPSLS